MITPPKQDEMSMRDLDSLTFVVLLIFEAGILPIDVIIIEANSVECLTLRGIVGKTISVSGVGAVVG